MRLVITADTHVPTRARDLPAQLWAAIDAADVVVHAGDWVDESLVDSLAARAGHLVAVFGNNDPPAIRARLPEVARVTLAGVRLAVVHETGPAAGREARCERLVADAYASGPTQLRADCDVLVFGHSHIPWDSVTPNGLRLLNPGSPTDRRRQPYATFLTAEITTTGLTGVVRHDLPRPGAEIRSDHGGDESVGGPR
jgi:uncharacterized protein